MKIQLVQMHPEINEREPDLGKEANLNKISDYVDKGLKAGANLIAFGECALVGYNLEDKIKYRDLCEPIPGPATEKIANKIRGKHTYVVFGMAEADGGCVYNSAPLIGPQGVVGVSRKLYLYNFYPHNERGPFKPGQCISIFDTEFGKVGLQICNDRNHTEISLAQALAGAWLIINITAIPIPIITEGKASDETKAAATIRANRAAAWEGRPAENEVCWANVNLVGDQLGKPFNGGSLIIMGSKGFLKSASIAGEAKEEVLTAEVDPEEIYKARRLIWHLRDTRVEILEQLLEIGKKSI